MDILSILWLFIILASLQPVLQRRFLELSRQRALSRLASERGSTIITLIHRQETMSFLGFPIVRYINIDDAEGVLNAIRATPYATPIDMSCTPLAGWFWPRARSPAPSPSTTDRLGPSSLTTQ